MKIIAKFLGRVNEYNEPPNLSYVTLKNMDTGEVVDTDAISERLKEKGIIYTDCEFEVLIQEDDTGKHSAILNKLEPREVSDTESISSEIDTELDFSDISLDI